MSTEESLHECSCGSLNCTRAHATDDVLAYLRHRREAYPPDVFPSQANGGDITGNAGAAARHVLTVAIDDIEKGEHIGWSLT